MATGAAREVGRSGHVHPERGLRQAGSVKPDGGPEEGPERRHQRCDHQLQA